MPDLFPSDFLQDVAEIGKDARQAKTLAGARAPLTEASAGWILRDRADPDTPPDGVHIYAQDGEFYVRTAGGIDRNIIPLRAAPVAIAANMTSGQIGGAPTQAQYNNLQSDAVEIRAQLNALINSLRAAGILLTF